MWQYAIIGGKRYSHLIDPHSGMALTDHSNVTVVGPDGLSTDGLSSAVAILGPEKGLKLVEATPHSAAFIVRLVNGKEQTFQSKRWRDLPRGGKLALRRSGNTSPTRLSKIVSVSSHRGTAVRTVSATGDSASPPRL